MSLPIDPLPSPSAPRRAPLWRLPALVFVLSLLVTGALSAVLMRALERRDLERFNHEVTRTLQAIRERVEITVALLRGTQGLFMASQEVSRAEFSAYVQRLQLRELYPGIQGIGFTAQVLAAQVPALQARLAAEGVNEFRIWPESPRAEYHAILYIEPMDQRNRAALGFDMYTHPVRRSAMQAARDSGEPRASGKVTLVQEIDVRKQAGFLIYVPVYRGGHPPPQDVSARQQALAGFVYSPLRVDDLLAGARRGGSPGPLLIDYELYDGPQATPEALMRRTLHEDSDHHPRFRVEHQLDAAGRPWLLRFSSRPELDAFSRERVAPVLVAVPVATSLLLAGIVLLQARARRTAEELAEAAQRNAALVQELQDNDRRKDEFLAMLGHELRNPLAPIVSSVGVLRRGVAPEPAARLHEVIERQARQLTHLVNDLLEASRISTGRLVIRPQPMLLDDALTGAVESVQPQLQQRRQRLLLQREGRPAPLMADSTRLAQVIANLLHNASKFSPEGAQIELRVQERPESVVITVKDTGRGIEPADLPRLFELFVQGQRHEDNTHGGLGIGLALVHRVVSLHGGRVEAASDGPGRGATFTVTLPRGGAEGAGPAPG